MLSFIKKHWIAYLVGATLAVALGFGASYLLGVKMVHPAGDTRAAHRGGGEQ